MYLQLICQDLQRKDSVGELAALKFRKDCVKGITHILKKIQEKSPLKYPVVRHMACLDCTAMYPDPDLCQGKMKNLVQKFLHDNQLLKESPLV